jgi:hypothetical protein
MVVEVFDPIAPARVFSLRNGGQSLAAIVDGAGSWGTGREAADLSRDILGALWAGATDWSTARLVRDITETALRTPENLRDPELGWSFSVTALLCTEGVVECVAAGLYRVDVVGPDKRETLFRPRMLADDVLAAGTFTPETIAAFPHRDICVGPFIGDNGKVSLVTASRALAVTDTVLVTHAARHNAALVPGSTLPTSAAALSAMAAPDSLPSPVIFMRQGLRDGR